MSKALQKHSERLLVVSDTSMFEENEQIKAFGPVVKELEKMLEIFDEIVWIGFNRPEEISNKSMLPIKSSKIKPILLKNVGGNEILDKLKIIIAYPKMYSVIRNEVQKNTIIHSRAPSNPSVIVMLLSLIYPNKIFWHKYAGSWVDKLSWFYRVQRFLLKLLKKNSYITINGSYDVKNKNILFFENPCVDENERLLGEMVVVSKNLTEKKVFCFVGALNEHKGVSKIIEAFSNLSEINKNLVEKVCFVGDGIQKQKYVNMSTKSGVEMEFLGFLPKDKIIEIYKKSNFIILPSKSEGFPKVIGEAMNYGCVPLVSNVSCIDQYIENNTNGFLIKPNTVEELIKAIEKAINTQNEIYQKMLMKNYILAEKFTYKYYNNRILSEIISE